ncbi:MAG: phage protease [Methylococcales bacterium]|nr:phage protease [Methylococcales bacterium]
MKTLLLTSLCAELKTDNGNVPSWVELIPAGLQVKGVDGRQWINDQPQTVLNRFTALKEQGLKLVFDFEHSSEHKAPKGDPAPATGWGVEMQARENSSIWVKVDWTEHGRNAVEKREYRYLSPVLIYEKNTRRIVGIQSVGLTNSPNLLNTALNQQSKHSKTEILMELPKAIASALGLDAEDSVESAVTAIKKLKGDVATANNRATNPALDKFVPRADYDVALNQTKEANEKLVTIEKQGRDSEIETAINQALKDGKITPATKDYHVANCQQEGGLKRFKEFVAAAPEIVAASNLDGKKPPKQDTALNAEQKSVADMFGNSAEDIAKYGTKVA